MERRTPLGLTLFLPGAPKPIEIAVSLLMFFCIAKVRVTSSTGSYKVFTTACPAANSFDCSSVKEILALAGEANKLTAIKAVTCNLAAHGD
jgi:hypothetical protein